MLEPTNPTAAQLAAMPARELDALAHITLWTRHNIDGDNIDGVWYCDGLHENSAGCNHAPLPRY
ncbi:hypothetical protein, partial [Propionibacterium freudenreichii]|uniref:hypothetical protein n=1 Tax=Propionibacterium freudenreichii TaxID=1744 RepID=UPI0038537198